MISVLLRLNRMGIRKEMNLWDEFRAPATHHCRHHWQGNKFGVERGERRIERRENINETSSKERGDDVYATYA
jgi:hypothetical protein